MTPEERKRRVQEVMRAAKRGILLEPPHDREEWRLEQEAGTLPQVDDTPSDDGEKADKAQQAAAR